MKTLVPIILACAACASIGWLAAFATAFATPRVSLRITTDPFACMDLAGCVRACPGPILVSRTTEEWRKQFATKDEWKCECYWGSR